MQPTEAFFAETEWTPRFTPPIKHCFRCEGPVFYLAVADANGDSVVQAIDVEPQSWGYLMLTSNHSAERITDENCDTPQLLYVLHEDLCPASQEVATES